MLRNSVFRRQMSTSGYEQQNAGKRVTVRMWCRLSDGSSFQSWRWRLEMPVPVSTTIGWNCQTVGGYRPEPLSSNFTVQVKYYESTTGNLVHRHLPPQQNT